MTPTSPNASNSAHASTAAENKIATRHRSTLKVVLEVVKVIIYDICLWFFDLIVHTFFREVKSRGTFHIPRTGPIIFVIAPHANQFIDPLLVMLKVRHYSGRRIAFLTAAKSYRRKFIGMFARLTGAIPVERAQDLLKAAPGTIKIDLDGDATVVKGTGTRFTRDCQKKGLLGLPDSLGNAVVEEVVSDTELRLRKPFQLGKKEQQITDRLTNGTTYKVAPHVDNNVVFQNVFNHLNGGKVLGIFPEGGSHDRPDLLPLKPGVAIMALGAASTSPDPHAVINVIPVGMNYFHPHRFRSRAVIEFGKPIRVDKKRSKMYEDNSKAAVDALLETITLGLREVTVTCTDYDTLMALQAARRLYTSARREQIPLPMIVEMNRRLVRGYEKYAYNPEVKEMKTMVSEYNKKLMRMGLHDHQVELLSSSDRFKTLVTFSDRLFKVFLFFGLSLPGIFLFSPVFITARRISRQKAKEALAGSVVKIRARDVLSTWKILVALGLAPALYIFYSVIGTVFLVQLGLVPQVPVFVVFLVCYGWSVLTTYASLRIGEIGVDYYKSLKPLFYSLMSAHKDVGQIEELKKNRAYLAERVTEFCDKFGPGLFSDYDRFYKRYNGVTDFDEFYDHEEPSLAYSGFNIHNLADVPIFSGEASDSDNGEEAVGHEEVIPTSEKTKLRLRKAMQERREEEEGNGEN